MEYSFDETTPRMVALKELALEYKKHLSTDVAEKILKRVDLLIIRTIKRQLGQFPKLLIVDAEELYQTAVAGALRGARTVKKKEPPRYVPARIVSYIKLEIYNYHLAQIRCTNEVEVEDLDEARLHQRRQLPAYLWSMVEVDTEMVKERLRGAIRDKQITEQEVTLFFDIYVHGHKMKYISEHHGINRVNMRELAQHALYKIRDLFSDDSGAYFDA